MSETLQTSKPESTSSGETGRGCQRGGEYRRCRGWRFFRVVAVFLLIGVGVLIGKATHHEHGPWWHGYPGQATVSASQPLPVGKLLDDIGATPEQRQKADAALHR